MFRLRRLWRVLVACILVAGFSILGGAQMGLFSGSRPVNLGVREGRLAPPKRTPNCVSSQADRLTDPQHYIAPLSYAGDAARAWAELRRMVSAMPRARLVSADAHYLHVEFASRLMRFVDDAEFLLDEKAGVIHLRSAARLGRRDFGVNRERIEALRLAFARAQRGAQ